MFRYLDNKYLFKICRKIKEIPTTAKKELEKEKGWWYEWINSDWYYVFKSTPSNEGERKIINELADNCLTKEEKEGSGKIIFEFERKRFDFFPGRKRFFWSFRVINQNLYRNEKDSEVEKRAKQFFKNVVYGYYKNYSSGGESDLIEFQPFNK